MQNVRMRKRKYQIKHLKQFVQKSYFDLGKRFCKRKLIVCSNMFKYGKIWAILHILHEKLLYGKYGEIWASYFSMKVIIWPIKKVL